MIKYFLLICCFLAGTRAFAGYGDWNVYAAYHNAQRTLEIGGRIFVLCDGGLYSYDTEDTSVETYDKATVLNDNNIYDIALCEATNELVIVYVNGNIDFMASDGSVFNLSDLKTASFGDKTINDVMVDDGTLYISMNGGVVLVDAESKVFGNLYTFDSNVFSVGISEDVMYVAARDGVYKGDMRQNLLDRASWVKLQSYSIPKLVNFNGTFYAVTSSGVYVVPDKSTFRINNLTREKFTRWSIANNMLLLSNDTSFSVIDAEGRLTSYGNTGILSAAYYNGGYWAACGTSGLKCFRFDGTKFEETMSSVIPDSPVRNYTYQLRMMPDERLLIAGGSFNYPAVNRTGTVMKYENNTWSAFEEDAVIAAVGANYYTKVTDVVQDPDDSEHHFVGTATSGIYEFRNYEYVGNYTCTNSPLTSILPDNANPGLYVRATGLEYDKEGNLWMFNNECDTIVRILKKDGTWKALYFNEIAKYPTFDHYLFDSRGLIWFNSRRTTSTVGRAGVFALDINGTLDNDADDTRRFVYSFNNQDGKNYQPTEFNCLTEDLDGAIWFGTSVGLFVSYNPGNVFSSDFYLTQVKVPRNDGTNLADYLLSDVPVKCIAVDGGNRKWIGTSGNGVYLVGADGTEILEHFTVDNSPLVSDDIYSIAINGSTGEVFIATGDGLVSYMGNATDPEESFNKDVVKVYPNPVRPEYQGNVTITGLMYNSNVKIVNAAGRLVHEGTSVGGAYTWNCATSSGRRVGSGVYYVLATDEEGNDGVASKILVIR
ncbi:MAG: Por secretion system protein [Bacteroides sp.]|nr:hypothetical protein [Roseburia sp.]MCM1347380.1 Por secretion system protein [Bacteroides sp.]MCM1421857.1 Por secretion system protein [Bacteroides sp.]